MKFMPQHDQMDCGPACLSMIANHYGKELSIQYLREQTHITREGISMLGISEAAKEIGFDTLPAKLSLVNLIELITAGKVPLPSIIHWNQTHFIILNKIHKSFFTGKLKFKLVDPGYGYISVTENKFRESWGGQNNEGVALFLEPNQKFYYQNAVKKKKISFQYLTEIVSFHKKQLIYIFILLLLGSGANLILPFLTQNMIDKGINHKDMNYISLILIAQISLFVGITIFDIIRNWITLSVGTRLNIKIISDFLRKMLKLPIKFFDSKMIGDLQQRIQDNNRIENFITSQSILVVFSIITFVVYFGVLCYYDYKILFIYLLLSSIAIIWSFIWLRKRKIVDYFRFQEQSRSHSSIYEILNGVTEMKLNQFEDFKRKEWESVQEKVFTINKRILRIDQYQNSGYEFFNQLKNILVTFLSAYYVVNGKMTLGEMMSVSYIIGQMNSPINQLVNFFRSLQDARLSMERLSEVQEISEEEQANQLQISKDNCFKNPNGINGIRISNLSFQYQGPASPFVLKDIDLFIPEGKITAIVGSSGSGKTTLMKLLLKFYEPVQGEIFYNSYKLKDLSALSLRKNTGVVMEDGYIFADSIERNIATSDQEIDKQRLDKTAQIACIKKFVEELPLGYKTLIGTSGNGISGGQKQRILIARAVYRNPAYIFFDEATSALDAKSEKLIHDSLNQFFKGKTVLIIAHRLSTVKNADQIVVLEQGKIVEIGKHEELVSTKGIYFNLIKNQLELGL